MAKFYIRANIAGNTESIPVEGKPVSIPGWGDYSLFVHRPVGDVNKKDGELEPVYSGGWTVSEESTGSSLGGGGTRVEAVKYAKYNMDRAGKKEIDKFISENRLDKPVSTGLPAGLSVKKVKGGWEVIHTKSGNRLMPFAYPEKQLATDFAVRAGQVADWTRPFKDLQAESEKLADLIRGGKKPGMFEKVLGMPTTFPKPNRKPLKDMTKSELGNLRVILHILPDGTMEIKEKGTDSLERQVASWNPPNRPDMTERSWVGGYISGELVASNAKKWLDMVAKKYDLDMDEIVSDSWRGGGMRHKASPYDYTKNTFTGKVKTAGSSLAKLQAIHESRSPRSKSADESQSNAVTIEPDDPRVDIWMRDPGGADVRGIDTPRKSSVRKPRKSKWASKTQTQVRGLR